MKEEWRDIKGYEGKYQVSNLGRVRSLIDSHGNYREKILNYSPKKDGYIQVSLCKKGKSKDFKLHRLVAEAFIPNSNNLSCINHKDEDKTNNCVSNLEWCNYSYNTNYGTRNRRVSEKLKGKEKTKEHCKNISLNHADFSGAKNPNSHKVICITTGEIFNCIIEASNYYNVNRTSISNNCNEKYKYAGKHPITGEKLVWRYLEEVE